MTTPEPWTLKTPARASGDDARDIAIIAGGEIIAEVFYRSDYTITHPVEANARLIAAAPRMLQFIREFLESTNYDADEAKARALLRDVMEG